MIVGGRRWRAADPSIPEALRSELVSALMAGRRRVRAEGDAARAVVHDAKVALGERGEPWWEEPTDAGVETRLAATIRTLLRTRGEKTICPSDAARVVGGERWRDLMPRAREVAVMLRDAGEVRILQRGVEVGGSAFRGPTRIAAAEAPDPAAPLS